MRLSTFLKEVFEKIRSSNIAVRLTSGAFWSLLGNIVGRGLVLLSFIIAARILGKQEYGEMGMIRSTIMMFSVFAGAGIGLTASRYIALYRGTNIRKTQEVYTLSYYFSIGLGLLIAILLCLFAPLIAEKSLHAPQLTNDIRIGAGVLFFIALNSAQNGILLGFELFKPIAFNTSIYGIAQLVFLAIGAYYWGIFGAIAGMGIATIVLWVINQRSIHSKTSKIFIEKIQLRKLSKETISILWKFSLPAAMSSILVIPALWWCKTFVVQTSGFGSIANYDVAEQWNNIILFIPSTLASMIMPILSNILAEGTSSQYKKLVTINILLNAIATTLIALFVCILTAFILKSYGAEFTDKNTFHILILSTIPNAVAAVLGQVIASKGKMWAGFILNLLWALWLILLSLFFIGNLKYGAFGLALAVLCAYILHAIFSYAYMWSRVINKKELL